MDFFSWLNFGWVGSLIGILGLIFGFVFFIKSYKTTVPCYQYSTNIIVGKKESEASKNIEILFLGKNVDNVKRTVVAIWNDGKHYLDNSVILREKPLTISFEDGEILSHQIKSKTNESIVSTTNMSENGGVIVEFNYLDFKDGVCVELIHTSNSNEPILSCTIKGVKGGFINKGKITSTTPSKKPKKFYYIIPVMGLLMIISGLASLHVASMKKEGQEDFITKFDSFGKSFLTISDKDYMTGWIMIISGAIYALTPVVMKFISRTKTPKNMDIS